MPEVRNAATGLALASVLVSILWRVILSTSGVMLYMNPAQTIYGLSLWQPVTWLIASADTWGVLFSALIFWSVGGSLERRWGRARFLRYSFGVTFFSGLLTLALAFALPDVLMRVPYMGGTVMSTLMWVSWGMVIWDEQTNFFGFPITGRTFAMIGILIPVLNALFENAMPMLVPSFIAILLAFAIVRFELSPSELWTRLQSARLQRDLKKRSSRLSVISGGDRNMPKDSDKYLH
jgi:membrane associated rhomboid family serine protease